MPVRAAIAAVNGIMRLKALIIDHALSTRTLVKEALRTLGVEVAGTASSVRGALSRIAPLGIDLVVLHADTEDMDAEEAVRGIKERTPGAGVVLLHSGVAGSRTREARPGSTGIHNVQVADGATPTETIEQLRGALSPLLKQVKKEKKERGEPACTRDRAPTPGRRDRSREVTVSFISTARTDLENFKPEVIAIGISTGGPAALTSVLPELPGDLAVPILIVQHMPATFTRSLAESLDVRSALRVKEAESGEAIMPCTAYVAPGGRQMAVESAPGRVAKVIALTDDPPENNCRPSADYLFRSVAAHFPGRALGVIMTGMGSDGSLGLRAMKETGSVVIAQDESSSVVFGMPRGAIEAGVVDVIAPLDRIASQILRLVKK